MQTVRVAELAMPPFPDMTDCRNCGAIAEIVDRFVLESTSGPVERMVVRCLNEHTLTVVD